MTMTLKRRIKLSGKRESRPVDFASGFLSILLAATALGFISAIVISAQKESERLEAQPVALSYALSETEAKLVAAKIEAAHQALYTTRFGRGVQIDVPTNTPIYAANPDGGSVTVRCALTQFGQVAIMGSAESTAFYKAGFLKDCQAGTVESGDLVGRTASSLQWSEHNQSGSIEPTLEPLELALAGTQSSDQTFVSSALRQTLAIQVAQNFQP